MPMNVPLKQRADMHAYSTQNSLQTALKQPPPAAK